MDSSTVVRQEAGGAEGRLPRAAETDEGGRARCPDVAVVPQVSAHVRSSEIEQALSICSICYMSIIL